MQALELFAGAGGLGIGISKAGFLPTMIVEWDRWCCDTIRENLSRHMSPVSHWPKPIEGDVRKVDFCPLEGRIELVTGGPPCQPFSLGGKHRAQDDTRDMWPEAVRAVRETKPLAFIFENVKGMTRSSFASYLAYVVHQLTYPELFRKPIERWDDHLARLEQHHTGNHRHSGLSYRVVYRVLNAANYGVPQKRERVVFVGFRSDLEINWSFPEETHSREALLWDQGKFGEYWKRHDVPIPTQNVTFSTAERMLASSERPSLLPWRTVRDAVSNLPDPERSPQAAAEYLNHRFQAGARSYPGHTGSRFDEPAKTLKAGVHGVPGGENMLVRPDGSIRYFSVRESARLQTFPDNYFFNGAWSEAMRQLGNAVPVELACIIAKNVREHLAFAVGLPR